MNYRITTSLRPDINNNEANSVLKCLHSLGFTEVISVRMSKFIEISGDGRKIDPEKIAKALANPVMEDYIIEKSKNEWRYKNDSKIKGEDND